MIARHHHEIGNDGEQDERQDRFNRHGKPRSRSRICQCVPGGGHLIHLYQAPTVNRLAAGSRRSARSPLVDCLTIRR